MTPLYNYHKKILFGKGGFYFPDLLVQFLPAKDPKVVVSSFVRSDVEFTDDFMPSAQV